MVAEAGAALDAVVAAGGEIVRPVDPAAGEVFAWFADPGGNVLGVYQQPGLAEAEATANEEAPVAQHVNPVPEHLHTVTPRLVFRDARSAIEFYREAFGADQFEQPHLGPGGMVVHAEIRIGDSSVFLTDEGTTGARRSPHRRPMAG